MNRRLTEPLGEPSPRTPAPTVTAVVAIGANLGDRAQTIAEAIAEIDRLPLTSVIRAAEPIETVAVTVDGPRDDAPRYLNTVALVSTRLAPAILLEHLHAVEDRHGRVRRQRWGDRTLDLDLITYGDLTIDTPTLTVPHPRAAEREFVLAPWLSIDPDASIVGVGQVADLLAALRSQPGPDEASA